MGKPAVVVFENSTSVTDVICDSLVGHELSISRSKDRASLRPMLCGSDLVILGPSASQAGSLLELGQSIRRSAPDAAMLLLASRSSEDLAIAALRAGVTEYVKYPFATEELTNAVWRCVAVQPSRNEDQLPGWDDFHMVGESASMREVKGRLRRLAASGCNILITGETGTGKELVAEQMHKGSSRSHRPFVTLNCAAIPDTLLESELFGYERGAFTGAVTRQDGKIKAADGGSIFLDEIAEMSPYGQAKILRMIEGKEIQRLGRNGGISVDVRIIAATNQDLEQMVSEGKFRKDLFFRLNVARIHLPPLRERKEDLGPLIQHYVRHFNQILGNKVDRLSDEAMAALSAYDWPGNVRELKNLVESIFVELPPNGERRPNLPVLFRRHCEDLQVTTGNEKDRLLWALSMSNWNKSSAASKLRWSRMTLYSKMARYNIT
jgi:DNA-binding NtrC family response regulator